MINKKLNIALFSPNENPYSETFIQAHKNYLDGNVFYYFGTGIGIRLEKHKAMMGYYTNLLLKIYAKITKKSSSYIWKKRILHSLKFNNIDVVLVEYGTHAHHLREVLRRSGLPVVVHFHGYDASVRSVLSDCGNYKEVFQLSQKVIAVSYVMKDKLLSIGCPSKKIVVNRCGPQPEFEEVIPLFSKKQFLSVGRFTDKKAPYYTILAFKDVLREYPNAQLLLAGDGALFNSCLNLIKYYGIENNIKMLGVIKPEEFRDLLKESIALVQHSITSLSGDMEGTPVAVLEASIAGLPVISTIHAGIPEVIIHGETGLLSKEHDVDTMTSHMKLILSDVESAKKLGAAGKLNVSEHFNLKKHINLLQLTLENAKK
ncbi:glycosyltransferase [Ulvibacter litoralis]|uniref:Glycosyltransferase involved in cell wall bisynthesis n=1 Tax=Ulvibacter litoralis TaxID=227084 RepID=A0A1G7GV74_9FLAO|nr:glycosyltransferase [Ulvibacter litoralis]GHC60002.1 hypothetical protein GCM10008083_26260 [Ulvibacter litoralis]SDE91953.1 Glycosyltransferase involved in cell wall bisynthesis [Ulvibacter litoralis]